MVTTKSFKELTDEEKQELSVKLYLNANFISIGVKINTIEKDKIVASKYFINFLLKI